MHNVTAPKRKSKGCTLVIEAPKPRIDPNFLRMMAARSGKHCKRHSRSSDRRHVAKEHGF